ncbi:MAG: hypothetical protein HRU41_23740 [Saprospiraceae bacterium]|nr:hypothetical protein [Saprospiraceae bacterium]
MDVDPLSVAILIGMGGSFITVWMTNQLGGRMEAYVQRVSHSWVQLPQRIMMVVGIVGFNFLALNYFMIKEYDKDLFKVLENLPAIPEPIKWFFRQLSTEFRSIISLLSDIPQIAPLFFSLGIIFFGYLLLGLFGLGRMQKWVVSIIVFFGLMFLFKDNFANVERRSQDRDLPWESYEPSVAPADDPALLKF